TGLGIWALGSHLGDQLESLFEQLPKSYDAVRGEVAKIPWLHSVFRLGARPAPPEVSPNKIVLGATTLLSGTFEIGVAFIAIFFIGVYSAVQPEAYSRAVLAL